MKIRIAGIVEESYVDGEGIRFAIFMQGCLRNCKGCHNPETHALDGGKILDTEEIIAKIKKNPLLTGITLTGGEPLLQIAPALELAKNARNLGLDVWLYTGYKFEEIPNDAAELLNFVDVVVDGEYIEELRDLDLKFRGSKNQQIIYLRRCSNDSD
ncbi:MAG: anaerobic ribonucleoside-triphosphate reductase activating protein [Selenomonadaceae bacterium]|nr:anaerobic ribonucleoside-triphosphate reductase activating protein [Selenomonadaceae bacterium]